MHKDNTHTIEFIDSISRVPARDWNRLVRHRYPFLDHRFMSALENHGCIGEVHGWLPRHLCCFEAGRLVAALPLYEKHNTWGEFVFDYAWAEAYARYGLAYYPKLVCALPFTPATGQRLLARQSGRDTIARRLVAAQLDFMAREAYSSIHCLFPDSADFERLKQQGARWRYDCQFHWHNPGYRDFAEFLAALKSRKRKKILHERRRVRDAGLTIRWLDGHRASERDWADFTRLYRNIYNRKYGRPAFNQEFFMAIAAAMPEQIQLALADHNQRPVAAALMYCDDHTLYGRHWGCDSRFDGLHFELCYYQGIEFCIRMGLKKFDPGAQGEHKLARGFLPTATRSLHWIADPDFNEAIGNFVRREQQGVQQYIEAAGAHSPYHNLPSQPVASTA